MLPHTPTPATRPNTGREWTWLTAALVAGAVGFALSVATASGQSVTVGVGELRAGETHRQDVVEVEAGWSEDRWMAALNASFRHGERDNGNDPWPPFLAVTAGPRIGPLALVAGMQSYPWDVGRWTPLAGPRLDVALGHRVRLHLSHYWREEGLVGARMTRWTGRTLFRLDLRLWGGR